MNICKYCIVGGALLGLVACRSTAPADKPAVVVKTEPVQAWRLDMQTAYPGRIKAAADVDLSFRVAGPIFRMEAEEGKFVRKGEVLAEIDPRDYALQFSATEAEYKQVKAEAERVIELV